MEIVTYMYTRGTLVICNHVGQLLYVYTWGTCYMYTHGEFVICIRVGHSWLSG